MARKKKKNVSKKRQNRVNHKKTKIRKKVKHEVYGQSFRLISLHPQPDPVDDPVVPALAS